MPGFTDGLGPSPSQINAELPCYCWIFGGDPRDIAEAVAYLVPDRAQWITGVSLIVDGGELPVI